MLGETHLGVALGVLKQVKEELARLLWPAALRGTRHLGLCVAADAAVEIAERDSLLVLKHILQVLFRLLERHVADGIRSDARVLEVHTQI